MSRTLKAVSGFAGLLLLILVVLAVVFYQGLHFTPFACGPRAKILHDYDAENETLALTHAGGDRLQPHGRVVVALTDNQTGRVETALWLQNDSESGIGPADTLRITGQRNATATTVTFSLDSKDHVRVLWLYPRAESGGEECERPWVIAEFIIGERTG